MTEASLTAMGGALLTWVLVVLVLAAVAEKLGDALKMTKYFSSRQDTLKDLFGYPSIVHILNEPPGVLASILRTQMAAGPLVYPPAYAPTPDAARVRLEALLDEIGAAPLVGPTAQSMDMATLLVAGGAPPGPSMQAIASSVTQASIARDIRALLIWVIAQTDRARASVAGKRVLKLRAASMFAAILLAWAVQIDTLELLRTLYGKEILLYSSKDHTRWIGVLLTGIAAGAGTPFWHDILDSISASRTKVEALKPSKPAAPPALPEA